MRLTELEEDCLWAIYRSEYYDGFGMPHIWSFSISDHVKITKKNQISGVISSLVKKGIVKCLGGRGKDGDSILICNEEIHEYAKKKNWRD